MKTTPNISMPSYSQQAMRRHRPGVGAWARPVTAGDEAGSAAEWGKIGEGIPVRVSSNRATEDTTRSCLGSPVQGKWGLPPRHLRQPRAWLGEGLELPQGSPQVLFRPLLMQGLAVALPVPAGWPGTLEQRHEGRCR